MELLRQQCDLYEQLRNLTEKQFQITGTNNPQMLWEVVCERKKLVNQLRDINDQMRPMKNRWRKLSGKLDPEYRTQAFNTACQVQQVIGEIMSISPPEQCTQMRLEHDWQFDKVIQ